ncbi:hypothetical protein LCD35_22675 [Saccharopolyspora sp. 6V]|nr:MULTISPECIES: hypothetical protein [Saccharopolyspora]MCA1189578.1 hypothetical protein [Saccharopolyspora sp. 6T]MCA1194955.1 hypothetical protein [Saccharopolyspora sp. 6V]MCA1227623.1 hypothetical protein [Saccharopolyspora sp. 6M]MCA1281719.1 hypothetical protein [Saccharopolyspora sp. 7B]
MHERTAADRREQLEGGLRPVRCDRCGTCVLAKKNSPAHTSVQWTRRAAQDCPALADAARGGSTAHVPGCPDLEDSIGARLRHDREAP